MRIRPFSLREVISSIRTFFLWHRLRLYALNQIGWINSRNTHQSQGFFKPVPWMTYSSIDFVSQCVKVEGKVLEFGSGNSTLWWLDRGNTVVSLETDATWCNSISAKIELLGLKERATILAVDEITPQILSEYDDHSFDIIVNDGHGDRVLILSEILRLLSPAGILIWDNSDRFEYQSGRDTLKTQGYRELRFSGMGPINAYAWVTSIFFKDFRSFSFVDQDSDFLSIQY
jgi:hypothetical protein